MPCVHNDVKCRPGLNYEPEIMKAHYYYVDQFLPINFAFEKLKLSLLSLSLSYLFIYLPTDVIPQEKKKLQLPLDLSAKHQNMQFLQNQHTKLAEAKRYLLTW